MVSITFIDSGVPFDPLNKADPDVTLSAEERKIGGLGIYMSKKAMDDMRYAYADGKNDLFDLSALIPADSVFVYNYPGIRMEDDDYFVFDTPFGLKGKFAKQGKKLPLQSVVFVDSERFDSRR